MQLEHSRGLIQGLVLVQGHARCAVALASAACIHTSAGEMTPKGTFTYSSHQLATHHWSTPGNTSRVPDSTHFSHLSLIARRCSFCSFDQLGGLTLTDSESPGVSLAPRIKLVAEKASVLQPAISPGNHQQHDPGFPMSRTELFTDDHQRMPGHTTILTFISCKVLLPNATALHALTYIPKAV